MNAAATCPGFAWIGQSLEHCDRCGKPHREHTHFEILNREKGIGHYRRVLIKKPFAPETCS
jgi:hypothetical protein